MLGQLVKLSKPKSIRKTLEENHGGKWSYNKHAHWWECNGGRIARWTCTCLCDEPCNHPSTMFIYGKGIPERANLK